jgi:chitosanase
MTPLQKAAAQAIVNIFETSRIAGDYASITLLKDDAGHLTYGRSQTTLASGNLYLLIADYCAAPGAARAESLRSYLPRLQARDLTLDNDANLRSILRQAGQDDPVMARVQDAFFDRVYWEPSQFSAKTAGLTTALAGGVVYDSTVHGAWRALRDKTNTAVGTVAALGEKKWVAGYIATRRAWLAGHANLLLRKTVYRMDTFASLIQQDRWDLTLPLSVRGITIDEEALTGRFIRAAADTERILHLATPPLTGDDVRALQKALIAAGYAVTADGSFGAKTDTAIRAFQTAYGLKSDGVVGPATRARLGL